MKKLLVTSLAVAALAGCNSTSVNWEQGNQAVVAESNVALKSNLWIDKMPSIGEVRDQNVHGALYLESEQPLPAELVVESVSIKQGEEVWLIDSDSLDLRTHNESQWEVAFTWQLELDSEQPVDIAVQIDTNGVKNWLVEKKVKVDTVY
ncbi:membrane lipoprotein lipid attachment site-containing protein [Vibrio paucivorans]|uniref:Membrane lipoprotein lipid attachment site-containing protein n=1 Tax=Vibrio paucivorans TaxID=2829489 RepID=A0A9X3CAP9_9VIBR|nr:membrane lipoprotein lipid attachment site-containing protein [Vibrio paucivorans]MCW8332224.1 membrane lipoprotein lipid attachment site-containing protein [Vibrio paucivorans]